ncbi:MAG: MMPL family transporter [Bacteroidia bacterium]|nr:MMPL family transporter [Bacteroidia bacterium]
MWTKRGTELVQQFSNVILTEEEDLKDYHKFQSYFGDDANVMVATVEGEIFSREMFADLYDLGIELSKQRGVIGVISLPRIYDVIRDDSLEGFRLSPVVSRRPESQQEVDSLASRIRNMPFYEGLLLDKTGKTTLIAVSFDPKLLDTDEKISILNETRAVIDRFGEKHAIEPRFAGFPVIRVNMHETVKKELFLFLVLALIVTAITLALFFRSFSTVFFPMIVVGSVIIFSMGLIGLFHYKMSLITGIIPALVTVISIPNCVYLITKYHIEFRRTGNKFKALILVIERIGIVTVMTNATTAVGLGVLIFTNIQPLKEFGIVAGLSVVAAFFISLLLIPIVFSFLPPPTRNQTRHLDRRTVGAALKAIDYIVHNQRWAVYVFSALMAGLSIIGMLKIVPVAYMVDDVPQDSKLFTDLKYIEDRFNGALPFEILVDAKKKRGVLRLQTLQQIAQLQDSLSKYDNLSRSVSVADFAKFFRQSFFEGAPEAYELPSRNEFNFIVDYARRTEFFGTGTAALSKNLADSTMQVTRISASVRDIGSLEMEKLVDSVRKDVDAIFDPEKFDVAITGTTQIFIKANDALIQNLIQSLVLAFVVIAIMMGVLFRSVKMAIISLIPNVLPLLMVAGIMGFAGIALKPSTALVFGVALGIAVDDTIHYLARYRLARKLGDTVNDAISNSFQDTGVSMIYTSVILFIGFVCFTASDFGGIQALGILISLILGIAMFSNLLFLPSLLATFDRDDRPLFT